MRKNTSGKTNKTNPNAMDMLQLPYRKKDDDSGDEYKTNSDDEALESLEDQSYSSTRAVANHLHKVVKERKLKFMGCFMQATALQGTCRITVENDMLQFTLTASPEPERQYAPLNQTIMSGSNYKKQLTNNIPRKQPEMSYSE